MCTAARRMQLKVPMRFTLMTRVNSSSLAGPDLPSVFMAVPMPEAPPVTTARTDASSMEVLLGRNGILEIESHAHALFPGRAAPDPLRVSGLRPIVRHLPARIPLLRRAGASVHAAPGTAGGGRVSARDVGGPLRRRELAPGDRRR